MSKEIFKREIKNTIFSKRFLIYLFLIYLPLAIGIWFSYKMYNDPSILENFTSFLPNPIEKVNPNVAMMLHLDLSMLSIALVAILEGSEFIAGEKEKGTLKILVSKPIKRYKILLAKYFAFVTIFLPLLIISTTAMATALYYIGFGLISYDIFIAYLVGFLLFGIIYTNITTLFSSFTKKSTTASSLSFIFLIGWITLDFLITYLPNEINNLLEEFSLSHHINKVIGYLSDGKAALIATGANPLDPTTRSLIYTTIVLLLILTIIPILLSTYFLNKSDVGIY